MNSTLIIIISLISLVLIETFLLYFEKLVIHEVFEENNDLKIRLFDLVKLEEKRYSDLVNSDRLKFDEKCLYDVARRLEVVERKIKCGTEEKRKLEVYSPVKEGK